MSVSELMQLMTGSLSCEMLSKRTSPRLADRPTRVRRSDTLSNAFIHSFIVANSVRSILAVTAAAADYYLAITVECTVQLLRDWLCATMCRSDDKLPINLHVSCRLIQTTRACEHPISVSCYVAQKTLYRM